MSEVIKLPYVSRYFSGEHLNLGWLKAVTVNNNVSARRLEWHDHEELELIFPLKGHYRYEFQDRRTVSLGNENFIAIPGGVMHRLNEAIDPPGARIHIYLKNPAERSATNGTFTAAEYSRLYQALSRHPLTRRRVSPQMKAALLPLSRIVIPSAPELPETARMQVRFLCCLLLCSSASGGICTGDKTDNNILDEAVKWLEGNYSSCVSMDRLIEHIGYSRPRFFALFKRRTNMTPCEYLRSYRIEKAKEMLLHTKLSATEVGKACGLSEATQFSRLFKKMTGLTPLAYRQQKSD